MMNIVVTGASRGIGFDVALRLSEGHRVLALSRSLEGLERLRQAAPSVQALPFDLTGPLDGAVEAIGKQLGTVDVLVNNAGALLHKPFEQLAPADWRAMFEVNAIGPARLIQALLPLLSAPARTAPGPAHVVNIGSMGGFQGSSKFPGLAAYSASKAALANLTECLAEELKHRNMAVNCLALGAVQTEMLEQAFPGYQAPLSSGQMAEFVAQFALTGQQFFNGKILPVSLSTP
jgi:NAD(P)-dependent dehydrogenase (short-subunit alcohol dehydrogenase family)